MLRLAISLGALLGASTLPAQIAAPRQAPSAVQQPAGAPDALHETGEHVTISLLTMSVGSQLWELFGHNALWIHDDLTGRDTVFNWGAFDFHQERFLQRFLKGTMLYAMSGDSLGQIPWAYRILNRTVYAQQLDLTASERDSVLHQVQWYARPENVNYRYDYYRNNCSTRVRDIIDAALHGQMKAKAGGLTGVTYRSESLRLMEPMPAIMVGADIGLGRPSDHELTTWEDMFLPQKLHDFAKSLEITGSDGRTHPLVRREVLLYRDTRPPEPAAPPMLLPWLLGAGVIIGGLFAWLAARSAGGSSGARVAAAFVIGLWTFVAGLLGLILTFLWTATDHVFAHANENLLLFNPLWLVLAAVLIPALWTGRSNRWAKGLATLLAGVAVLALIMHVVRLSAQDNWAVMGLALPPALAIAWAARRGASRPA